MSQRRLSTEQKIFIVRRAAVYESPAEIRAAFKAEYGFAPSPQSLASYDLDNATGSRDLGAELTAVFEETRAAFRADGNSIAIASKAWRLRQLERMARDAQAKQEYGMAAQLLEQAARDVGDAYTNLRKHAGPNGQPLQSSGAIIVIPDNGRDTKPEDTSERRIEGMLELMHRALERAEKEDPEWAERYKTRFPPGIGIDDHDDGKDDDEPAVRTIANTAPRRSLGR